MRKTAILFLLGLMGLLPSSCNGFDPFKQFNNEESDNQNSALIYTVINDYLDGLNAIISDNGSVILFNEGEEGEGNLYLFQYNSDYIIDEDSQVYIKVNSSFYPTTIASKDYLVLISYDEETSNYECTYLNERGDYSVLNLRLDNAEHNNNVTKANASGSGITFGDVAGAIGKASAVGGAIQAAGANIGTKVLTGINLAGSVLVEGVAGEIMSGVTDMLLGSIEGGLLGLAGMISNAEHSFQEKHLGNWKIEVISAKQINRTQCQVDYVISGINENPEGKPRFKILWQNLKTGKYSNKDLGVATNSVESVIIDTPTGAEYGIEMRLYDDCHRVTNISYLSYPPYKINVANIGLDNYKIISEGKYQKDKTVKYDMEVSVSGYLDASAIQEAGFYVKYANQIDYHKVSTTGEFSGLSMKTELCVDRESFFDKNYSSFRAVADEYYIGIYAKFKNGNYHEFDEQQLSGLTYSLAPSVRFTGAQINGTEVLSRSTDENGKETVEFKTSFTLKAQITGCFWMNYLQMQVVGNNWNNEWSPSYVTDDGEYTFNGNCHYYSSSTLAHNLYFLIYLDNGNTLSSDNGVSFGGSGTITSITLSGSSAGAPSSIFTMKTNKLNVSSYVNTNLSL